jgi:hypothetical protein
VTIDRNALATDLEQLDLKAIAGAVRKNTISVERVLASVKRAYETRRFVGDTERADLAKEILDRYSEGDTSDA